MSMTEEHKRKIGLANKGKKHTEESKKKQSLANMGNLNRLKVTPVLHAKILQLRGNGMTAGDVAKRLHLSIATVYNWSRRSL